MPVVKWTKQSVDRDTKTQQTRKRAFSGAEKQDSGLLLPTFFYSIHNSLNKRANSSKPQKEQQNQDQTPMNS